MKQKKLEKHGISSLETMQFLRKGWKVATIYRNSHQNYREGEQIYHSIDKPPKKEKVSLWVELNKKDDLVPIGNEELVLWNMSESEINELKSQVQTEMEHKRKEHIMPLNLQMSYDQIETAYEEVSEVMKTYDITEKDSDDEEVVEEEEADDDVEIRSFDVIIHDEMLKTVSRETVELGQTSQ